MTCDVFLTHLTQQNIVNIIDNTIEIAISARRLQNHQNNIVGELTLVKQITETDLAKN